MISKFFIERPVLSNVIALLMILIGGVSLFNLAVAQYPDVVPPTVQVTTRYPGASAKTVIDTVALPIEQQVNGVEDMLYMQSYSALRRHLFTDRHLQDRHRPQFRAGAGAEPRLQRARTIAGVGAEPGRHGPEEIDIDPAVRHADLARREVRQPLSEQLRHASISATSCRGCRASATSRCSAPGNIRCGSGSIRTSCRRAN